MDQDALNVVADDLEYLQGWGERISDAEVRRGTAVLRRLLIDDVYGTAWRAVGFEKQPSLVAVDLYKLIAPLQPADIKLGLSGGAKFKGFQMAAMIVHPGNPSQTTPSEPLRADGYPGEIKYRMSDFLASPSGVVDGETFSRSEVIKYIANIKGGVHLGSQERKMERKLVARLSKIDKKMRVFETDGLLVEVVAIGQAVGTSNDANRLIKAIRP